MTRGDIDTDEMDFTKYIERAQSGDVTGVAQGLYDWLTEVTGLKLDLKSVYLTRALGQTWQGSIWWAEARDEYMGTPEPKSGSNGHNRTTAPAARRGRPPKAAEPAPRRGRPPKAVADEPEDEPKRGRGRPRTVAPEPEPAAAPARRGRPPKAAASEPAAPAAPARRGRPPKAAAKPAPASGQRGKAASAAAPY